MLALIFTRKLRPMIIGSSSRWLMLAGMIARPRATSSRTNSAGSPSRSGDELHLRRDLALARVVQLRDRLPAGAAGARATHGSRSFGRPSRDVVTLRAAGVVDAKRTARRSTSAISRIGTRTPCGPSTRYFRGIGKRCG